MRIFWKKAVKIAAASGLCPRTLSAWALPPDPRVVTPANCYSILSSAFIIVLNAFYYDRRKNKLV